jgi:hypothetical protein
VSLQPLGARKLYFEYEPAYDPPETLEFVLENGEARPFDPFNRFEQLKESQEKSMEQLLDDFARLRTENLAEVRHRMNVERPKSFRIRSGYREVCTTF